MLWQLMTSQERESERGSMRLWERLSGDQFSRWSNGVRDWQHMRSDFFCTVIHAEYRDLALTSQRRARLRILHNYVHWLRHKQERECDRKIERARETEWESESGGLLSDTSAGRCNCAAVCESVFDPHWRLFIDLDKGLTIWRSQCPYLVKSGQREVLAAHSTKLVWLGLMNSLCVVW